MPRFIKMLVFLMICTSANGQVENGFVYYNNESYKLYTNASWKELIPLAKESIEKGHDFYYMRMRLGIAYYEVGKYIQAKRQFEKALDFYPSSVDAKNYLHYCYLYLGRNQEARAFYNINEEKPKFVRSLYFEPGIKLSDGKSSTRDVRYFFVGLNHELGHRISFFQGYQRLGADFVTTTTVNNGPGPGGVFFSTEYAYTVTQNEYYASLGFLIGKGFYLIPAYHIQNVNGWEYTGKNHVYSIQVAKWLSRIKLYGGYYHSEINELSQQQIEGGIVYYPIGNTNFYLQTQGTGHYDNSRNNFVWFNKIGIRALPKTWLEGFFTTGDMLNYSETNGYIVYNQLDMIKSKWGVSINQYIGKHLLFFNYTLENKEEYSTGIPFLHHDFIMGLNITF